MEVGVVPLGVVVVAGGLGRDVRESEAVILR